MAIPRGYGRHTNIIRRRPCDQTSYKPKVPQPASCRGKLITEHFADIAVSPMEAEMMTDGKSRHYEAEAEKCRRLAKADACPDAREYYEALSRDYTKLAVAEQRTRQP